MPSDLSNYAVKTTISTMVNMDSVGADIDASGKVLSKEELILRRERAGRCVTCGVKCYEKTFTLFNKRVQLTVPGQVLNGICLRCHPEEQLAASVTAELSDSSNNTSTRSISVGKMMAQKLKFSKKKSETAPCSEESDEPRGSSSSITDHSTSYLRRMTPRPSSLTEDLKDAANIMQQLENYQIDDEHHSKCTDEVNDTASTSEKDALQALNQQDLSYADIVNIMAKNPQLAVMNEGLYALSLIHELDSNTAEETVNYGGFDVIINAMDVCAKDGIAQVNACKVIFIACLNGENVQRDIARAGAMKSLRNSIESFSDDEIVLEGCLLALSSLCIVEDNIVYMLEGDLIDQVIITMNGHLDCGGLQEHGCVILGLLARNVEARRRISKACGFNSIVISMAINHGDVEVQCQALTAVRAFCAIDDDSCKVLLATSGAVSAVLEAMKAHPDLNRVHEIGCDVIRLLSLGRNDDNYRLLGENGAYTVVVRSMWSHSQNIAIQERAVEALAVLSEHSNNVPVILDAGGIEAVLAAMHTFAESPHVQIKGCAMLSNFASAVDSIKVKIVDEGALDVIVMAMVLHSDNEEIQVRAVILLRKLCIKENVQRMITANISPVITVVEETLGDKLHEETSYIVAQLENAG